MSKHGIFLSVAEDEEGKNPRIVLETSGLPVQLLGASGLPVKVDDNNYMGVVSHAHDDGGHIHLKATGITADTNFILIDVSDTTNYPHDNTTWIHTANIVLSIDASNDADYLIRPGFLENVDGTDGDFFGVFDVSGSRKAGNSQSITIAQAPEAPKMRSVSFLGPSLLNQTAFNTATDIPSTISPAVADTPSGDGDIALIVEMNAGTINVSVLMGYHSH